MKTITYITALCWGLILISCNDDNGIDCDSINFGAEFQQEIDVITAASIQYAIDPSEENCLNFKTAFENYLELLRPFEDCNFTSSQQEEYENTVEQAEMTIEDLPC